MQILCRFFVIGLLFFHLSGIVCGQRTFYVSATGPQGDGTRNQPFTQIENAIKSLRPSDTLIFLPGTYNLAQRLPCPDNPSSDKYITIKGLDKSKTILTRPGTLLRINSPNIRIEHLTFDAQFATEQCIEIHENGRAAYIGQCTIRHGGSNGISLRQADDVTIENCTIHHMLRGTWSKQKDAHGIKASNQKNLTISGCEIFYVSGDCIQTDPSMRPPLWDNLLIDNCRLWTGPLPADAAGFRKGEVPGENAIDTKTDSTGSVPMIRARITIRNVEIFGFVRDGFINNRAALNLKHGIDCTIENIKIHHCQIAIRARGPHVMGGKPMPGAVVLIKNSTFYDNEIVIKPEHAVSNLTLRNCHFTFTGSQRFMQNADNKGLDYKTFSVTGCTFDPHIPAGIDISKNKAAKP